MTPDGKSSSWSRPRPAAFPDPPPRRADREHPESHIDDPRLHKTRPHDPPYPQRRVAANLPRALYNAPMQKITPFLWFDDKAEEAVNFYVSLFKNSKIVSMKRYPEGPLEGPMKGMEGKVLTAVFELEGQRFMALDGGPFFQPSGAVSFYVECETQEELDHYWSKLSEVRDGSRPWVSSSLITTICANRKTRTAICCRFSSQHIRLVRRGQTGTRISLVAADLSSSGATQEICPDKSASG